MNARTETVNIDLQFFQHLTNAGIPSAVLPRGLRYLSFCDFECFTGLSCRSAGAGGGFLSRVGCSGALSSTAYGFGY